ncbi:N-acetylglucosamine-6-phosphate deacetylase [Haloplasma contractile]|uniref:N-acetylglucosamine-6-phosphate deacetylase n=1 Tax=Haloplasma contractile SSD-17B TaxID=1033810 RepID=U2DZP7_9MOLU|nr:N-acetylglucosamine-6-phosphate deacetylase [Haloplasma contractile]ERJ13677.1 N-acetylglucosamine-6-phosphate deacetylase protein [Haloplasma contractile SSD-17B]
MQCIGIKNASILTPDGFKEGNLRINEGKIDELFCHDTSDFITFNGPVMVIPGFIDQHIHGAGNKDTMDGTNEAIRIIAKTIAKEGTTSFLATTMTQSKEAINQALKTVSNYMDQASIDGAEVLGVHLEGPFINKEACGAQPVEHIITPTVEQFKRFQDIAKGSIKMVTIAPEVDGAHELIKHLHENQVVASIGHTVATYNDVVKAIRSGARNVTHCYNAMTPLHHREPGVVGATFLHDELKAELIADGIHVCKESVNILYKNKMKDGIILITDAMRAKGLGDGTYDLGGQKVEVNGHEARLGNGTLAGSVLEYATGVKNMMHFTDTTIEDVSIMASQNPAKQIGVFDRKGSIEEGKDADLVILDQDYNVLMTICRGHIVYSK